jgi:hypothetical protein
LLLFFLQGIFVIAQEEIVRKIPFLQVTPKIDGNLTEWESFAYSDGQWNLDRIKKSSWYSPKRNTLTYHPGEDSTKSDLNAIYYMAWDNQYFYFGAKVHDNQIDVEELNHQPKRWYYKDAVAWFIEAPRDTIPEKFSDGDHAFAFILDTTKPDYGAWWRHGNATESYIEEALPKSAVDFVVKEEIDGGIILEARVNLKQTLGNDNLAWEAPKIGDSYSMMIVHCDPDGGEYGGHLLIYGKGDLDSTWGEIILAAEKQTFQDEE